MKKGLKILLDSKLIAPHDLPPIHNLPARINAYVAYLPTGDDQEAIRYGRTSH